MMVSFAEVRRPELALHWHEAVAIVAEVAAMLRSRGHTRVPALDTIILDADGTLRFLDEGRQSAAPGQQLGDMLDALLSPVPCPLELRRLVDDTKTDPPGHATLDAFAEALSFFERPGRQDLLKALATRASAVALEAHASTELERLETRTRSLPDAANARAGTPFSRTRRLVFFIAAAVVVLGAIAGGLLALLADTPAQATIKERMQASVERVDQLAKDAIAAINPAKSDAPAAPALESTSTSAPAAAPAQTASKSSRRSLTARPVAVSVKEVQAWSVASHSPSTPTDYPDAPAPADDAPDTTIYGADRTDVEPAVLLRPKLPTLAPSSVDPEDIGILEIIVSATGTVEQVRLISTANRFEESMLVAAAKAWPFEPAMKDGHRVRYRTRIRVTL
jgi:Gram-negative bacterial TonB protein C-terminal